MVTLHIAKQSQIVVLSLFLISLPSFCADGVAEQEVSKNITFSCNIPLLNAPLQLERTEDGVSKIALTLAAIDHGRLLHSQLKSQQNIQGMIIDHALLAAFRITIGITSTVCHEFGHAICAHYDPYATLRSITLRWSLVNILLGDFDGGYITREQNVPDVPEDDDQLVEIQCKNWIAYLKQDKSRYNNKMISCVAGPLMGALSAYMVYKGAGYVYPSLPYAPIVFVEIQQDVENMIPTKHMLNYFCDGASARARSDELKREIEALRAKGSTSSDGDQFYEAWKKRKKTQESIDKWSYACAKLNENAS